MNLSVNNLFMEALYMNLRFIKINSNQGINISEKCFNDLH